MPQVRRMTWRIEFGPTISGRPKIATIRSWVVRLTLTASRMAAHLHKWRNSIIGNGALQTLLFCQQAAVKWCLRTRTIASHSRGMTTGTVMLTIASSLSFGHDSFIPRTKNQSKISPAWRHPDRTHGGTCDWLNRDGRDVESLYGRQSHLSI